MSVGKIQKTLNELLDKKEELMFAEDELVDLVIGIAYHILGTPSRDKTITPPPNGYLTLSEFEKKYIFIAKNTLYKYCKDNPTFRKECAILHDGRWFVDEIKTIDYFQSIPLFKNRIKRNFFQEKLSQ